MVMTANNDLEWVINFPHFNIITEGIPQAKRIITNLQNAYGKYDSNRDYAIAEIYD